MRPTEEACRAASSTRRRLESGPTSLPGRIPQRETRCDVAPGLAEQEALRVDVWQKAMPVDPPGDTRQRRHALEGIRVGMERVMPIGRCTWQVAESIDGPDCRHTCRREQDDQRDGPPGRELTRNHDGHDQASDDRGEDEA